MAKLDSVSELFICEVAGGAMRARKIAPAFVKSNYGWQGNWKK
jgi:hypothetical protein